MVNFDIFVLASHQPGEVKALCSTPPLLGRGPNISSVFKAFAVSYGTVCVPAMQWPFWNLGCGLFLNLQVFDMCLCLVSFMHNVGMSLAKHLHIVVYAFLTHS